MAQLLLEVQKLSLSFKTKNGVITPVRDLSFKLSEGETLGVVGESGCGKSLTNLALMGLLPHNAVVNAEKLEFMGEDLLKLSDSSWQKIRGKKMAMVFQDPMTALNPCYTVAYQLEETLLTHTTLNKEERKKRALELMDQVGIPAANERLKAYSHELSGGMAQRVMIAMALAANPKLLIADEPTTALDVTIQDQILRLLSDIQKNHQMAMILVTHDLGVVAQNTKRIQVMYAGEVVETGPSESIIHNPRHPYTWALLNSLPAKHAREFRGRLPSISGLVPDLKSRPGGCQFSPRCEKVKDQCLLSNPHLEADPQGDGQIRCYYPMNKGP